MRMIQKKMKIGGQEQNKPEQSQSSLKYHTSGLSESNFDHTHRKKTIFMPTAILAEAYCFTLHEKPGML